MSIAEVLQSQVQFSMVSSAKFNDDIRKKRAGGLYTIGDATARLTATLGNFTVHAKVTQATYGDKWAVKGTFKVDDIYDFDWTRSEGERAIDDAKTTWRQYGDVNLNGGAYDGKRSLGAELKVIMMSRLKAANLGFDFAVTSEDVYFCQTEGQRYATIMSTP